MSEVEKMYENAGVEKVIPDICSNYEGDCIGCIGYIKGQKPYCKSVDYPPFTPKKQLEIVKWILFSKWWMSLKVCQFAEKFDERLAELVNDIWQTLTEQDRTGIADILKG